MVVSRSMTLVAGTVGEDLFADPIRATERATQGCTAVRHSGRHCHSILERGSAKPETLVNCSGEIVTTRSNIVLRTRPGSGTYPFKQLHVFGKRHLSDIGVSSGGRVTAMRGSGSTRTGVTLQTRRVSDAPGWNCDDIWHRPRSDGRTAATSCKGAGCDAIANGRTAGRKSGGERTSRCGLEHSRLFLAR